MRLQNELLDSKFTHSKKKPLTHNKKLLYIIFGCRIADPHFCNKLIIWGVGGGGGQQLPPQHCQLYMCLLFLLQDHKSGSTKSVEVLHGN
jgi:hypothetical protein